MALSSQGIAPGSSTSTDPTQPMRYHVFLSFRGPDTRKTFTDRLYAALARKGIVTFKDEETEIGDYIPARLRDAIRQSLYFIIVLSQEFASSAWCLDELQEILETKAEPRVIPLFYKVQPSHIGNQEGEVEAAFAKLKKKYPREQIDGWRQALSKVAKIYGHVNIENADEANLVEEIATKIWNKLCDQLPSNLEYLVGDMQLNVHQESPVNAGGRSRLWSWEDINAVLKENRGTEHVQSIILETQHVVGADWDANCFSKMINLRMLDLSKVHLWRELESLPTGLKFLRWDDYNKHRLPSIDKLWKLETLQLCNSKIKKLWKKNTVLDKLRIIDMRGSECLRETPDFCGTPNVEELLLDRCTKLVHVHESVGQLKNLVKLSLEDCKMLKTLPMKMETDKLQEFILKGCMRLQKLPDFGQNVTNLHFFDVSGTAITQIPSTISNLIGLEILDLWDCSELRSLPADLPPHLSVCLNNYRYLKHTIAQLNLCSLLDPKRPVDLQGTIHIVGVFKAGATALEWFRCSEYYWGKDPSSGEFVTTTADIPSKVVADSNEECWGIAVCLFLKSKSQALQSSYVVWKFQDRFNTEDKIELHGNLKPDDDWVVYVGFYPFDKKMCRPHPSDAEATQLDLSISFLTTSTARDFRDLAIMGCQWHLVTKVEFDEWMKDERAAAPSGHGSSNREREESSHGVTGTHGKGNYQQNLHEGEKEIPEVWQKKKQKEIAEGWQEKKQKEIAEDVPAKWGENAEDNPEQWGVSVEDSIPEEWGDISKDIGKFVGKKLDDEIPSNFEDLVGDIQSKVDKIISLLKMELDDDPHFIRISGESGIGKTTLARLVYDAIQSKFDATCFLDNVREDSERFGIVSLQMKLLSELGLGEHDIDDIPKGADIIKKYLRHKKVLIILDAVSHESQVENLARTKEWFGAGSKIVIITTGRDMFSTLYGQIEEYKVERLGLHESLKLLCQEAFKMYEPERAYLDLLKEVIEYACGLPLVLKVLGSFLFRKDANEWKNALKRLTKDACSPFRIGYDGLEDEECRRIFLDIACFFNREAKFKVTSKLESLRGFHSTRGMQVLIEKSMLNFTHSNSDLKKNATEEQDMHGMIQEVRRQIFLPTCFYDWLLQEASKECLYMHDLLQELGRNIVHGEYPINAGKRSRLWSLQDIDIVLKENKGTEHVQSIVLKTHQSFEADWDPNCFSKMINLRLLELSKVQLLRKLNSLPTALRFLRWDDYAEDCLPSIEGLQNLESLQLCNSRIRSLWEGSPELKQLRTIDLSNSDDLKETPDFSGTPNLERLLLNRCRELVKVHESVGQLKNLVELSLKECRRLEILPTKLKTGELAEFILNGCLRLKKLPEFSENMGSLYFFDLKGTAIIEIPHSIIHLKKLKYLDLTCCSRLKSIPKLPPNVIVSASNCHLLEPESALRCLYASFSPESPIHLFYDFPLWTRIPTWFERWEYCWGKDVSGEFVTITADIPSNVVADSNEERWGIAVCVVFQFLSQAWLGFSIDWKFEDCHRKKTKIHGTPPYYVHDCRVYVGFYPFDAKDCRQYPRGRGRRLDLALEFPATNIINGLRDLEIMGCGWRLACQKDFDEWSESRAPSPPRLGFLNRDRGESSNIALLKEIKGQRKIS